MKYMLLIYNNREALDALPEAELQAVFADVDRIMAELTASGELVGGGGLAAPSHGQDRARARRRRRHHRRAVRRGQGAVRRLPDASTCETEERGGRDRRELAGRQVLGDGGARR